MNADTSNPSSSRDAYSEPDTRGARPFGLPANRSKVTRSNCPAEAVDVGLNLTVAEQSLERVAAIYDSRASQVFEELLGESLHKGLFDPAERTKGLRLTAAQHVLEVACGTGGAARYLGAEYRCRVTATDLSTRHIETARDLTKKQGLSGLVRFARCDFHCLPFRSNAFDLWWSQESLLHAHDRRLVLREGHRVLKTGGLAVFSDLTIHRGAGDRERQKILRRTQSTSMWDARDYVEALQSLGFGVLGFADWSRYVEPTYSNMRTQIEGNRPAFVSRLGEAHLLGMLADLDVWIEQARLGNLGWAYLVAEKQ